MDETSNTIELATELTIAWLGNPNTRADPDAVPAFLQSMYTAVQALADTPVGPELQSAPDHVPAVGVRKSLASKDHIVSMIDGKPYRTLLRHLSTHGLTPDNYRARYGLRPDYPMVAPGYSEARRAMAKKVGLGRKPKTSVPQDTAPKPRSRKSAPTS